MLLFHSSKDQGPSSSSNKNTIAKSSILEVDIMIYLQLFDYFKYLRFLDTHFEFFFFKRIIWKDWEHNTFWKSDLVKVA